MGFRTVIMLSNDHAHQWAHDDQLGQKIYTAMNHTGCPQTSSLSYGRVVECTHADTTTLAFLRNYHAFKPVSYASDIRVSDLDMLKSAADSLGYKLVKRKQP